MSDVQKTTACLGEALADIRFPSGFLENYDQLECLACGCGTETYLVEGKVSHRLFIAKCYDRNIHRVVHESSILKALRHDGLPQFADEYQDDGMICVVREYIPGTPLDQYMRNCKPSDAQAVALCVHLCDLLLYLHGQKPPVIHRDIKPQNVIVKHDGSVALIDFGISRVYHNDAETDTQFIGTRRFAPAEQYGFSQTDARADVYSLGILLCWMLSGSTDVKTARIPHRRLAAIARRCAAFSPKERFSSAAAVKKALLGYDKTQEKRVLKISYVVAMAFLCLCAGFGIGRYTEYFAFPSTVQQIRFHEPLIERAVRLQLGKGAQDPLTEDDLATVKAIYIFGNEVALTKETFADGLSDERAKAQRGDIQTLEDVKLLPSLEELIVAYQTLSDIGPIQGAQNLASISLMHTRVSDISPLANMKSLTDVNLYDTDVTDVAILDTCPRLRFLDIGNTLVRSVESIGGRDSLECLQMDRLSFDTLDGLERFTRLTSLGLWRAAIRDMSALRAIPSLRLVALSEDAYARSEAIKDGVGFSVTFE